MRVAYADPPYVGQSRKHYGGAEVNHRLLVAHLCDEFPDGWALSCSTPSLRELLPLCPESVRVAAWVKPFAVFKPHVNPAYAWEPVIWRGGRQPRSRDEMTVRDWVSVDITLQKGTVGAKPDAFCWWLFDLLGLQAHDTVIDIFPGTGVVGRTWDRYRRQGKLFNVAIA